MFAKNNKEFNIKINRRRGKKNRLRVCSFIPTV